MKKKLFTVFSIIIALGILLSLSIKEEDAKGSYMFNGKNYGYFFVKSADINFGSSYEEVKTVISKDYKNEKLFDNNWLVMRLKKEGIEITSSYIFDEKDKLFKIFHLIKSDKQAESKGLLTYLDYKEILTEYYGENKEEKKDIKKEDGKIEKKAFWEFNGFTLTLISSRNDKEDVIGISYQETN